MTVSMAHRRPVARFLACAAMVALASCGGGTQQEPAQSPLGAEAQPPMYATQAQDEFLTWVETAYPQYFPGRKFTAGDSTSTWYRYYPETLNFVGVQGDRVYIHGPVAGNRVTYVAQISDFACRRDARDCFPAPIARISRAPIVGVQTLATLDSNTSSTTTNRELTYVWTMPSRPPGSSAVLRGSNPSVPLTGDRQAFTPDVAGNYVVRLVVSDGRKSSTTEAVVQAVPAAASPLLTLHSNLAFQQQPQPLPFTTTLTLAPSANRLNTMQQITQARLESLNARHTITNIATTDTSGVAGAHIDGIANGTVIEPGASVSFSLHAVSLQGPHTVTFSFGIAETGQTFLTRLVMPRY